jgi:hypothetical protein
MGGGTKQQEGLIEVEVADSYKDGEYFIGVHTPEYASVVTAYVPAEKVVEIREVSDRRLGHLIVNRVYESGDRVIVEIPGETVITGRRIPVPKAFFTPSLKSTTTD